MYRHIVRELERRKRLGGDLDDEDDQLTSSSSDSSDGEHSDGEEAVPVKRVRQLKRGASAASSSDEEGSDGTSESDSDDGTSNASDDDQSTEMHEDGTSEDGPKEDGSVEEEVEESPKRYECTLCPEKTLLNEQAVQAHLGSKLHQSRVAQAAKSARADKLRARRQRRKMLKAAKTAGTANGEERSSTAPIPVVEKGRAKSAKQVKPETGAASQSKAASKEAAIKPVKNVQVKAGDEIASKGRPTPAQSKDSLPKASQPDATAAAPRKRRKAL